MEQAVITVKGREYRVEKIVTNHSFTHLPESCNTMYMLIGARGTQYGLLRDYESPAFLTVAVGSRVLNGVVFTDVHGELEVVGR